MTETANSPDTDKYPWRFKPGQSGNPSGRPKNTMKDYVSRKLALMTDEEKEAWLRGVDKEFQWRMGEGQPSQETDITSGGKELEALTIIATKDEPDKTQPVAE